MWRDRLELVARVEWLNEAIGPVSPADAWGGAVGATFYTRARTVRLQAAYTLRRALSASGDGGDPAAVGWAVLRASFVM